MSFRETVAGLVMDLEDDIREALRDGTLMQRASFSRATIHNDGRGIGRVTIIIDGPMVVQDALDDARSLLDAYDEAIQEPDSLGG